MIEDRDTPRDLAGNAYAMAATEEVLHIERLPGGFLVGVTSKSPHYRRQVFASADQLIEFVRGWAPK